MEQEMPVEHAHQRQTFFFRVSFFVVADLVGGHILFPVMAKIFVPLCTDNSH